MSEDLLNEIEAINSIYGSSTLVSAHDSAESANEIYILTLPSQETSLRIQFPATYPDAPPNILGPQTVGESARKGDAGRLVEFVREAVGRTWRVGEECLFDDIEEEEGFEQSGDGDVEDGEREGGDDEEVGEEGIKRVGERKHSSQNDLEINDIPPPTWTLSLPLTELKSTFLARCVSVSSPHLATHYISHLLATDKKVRTATHNITAWRIRTEEGIIYQDCDDDGEAAAGGRLLHLMQLMDVWNVMVVVTRWYGGQKLGARRFEVINGVAREALVLGGFVHEKGDAKEGKKGRR